MKPRDFGYLVRPAAQLVGAYQLDAHTLEGGNHAREAVARLLTELGYDPEDPVLTDLLLASAHISSKLLDEVVAAEGEIRAGSLQEDQQADQTGAVTAMGRDESQRSGRTNKEILRDIVATFNEAKPEADPAEADSLLIVAEYTPTRNGWRVDVSTVHNGHTIVRASEGSGPPQAYQKAQSLIDQIQCRLPNEQVHVRHQVEGQEAGFRRWAAAYGW